MKISLKPTAEQWEPVYKAVERVLDEESAWIARPSPDVTKRVALAATIAVRLATEGQNQEQAAEIERLRAVLREARDFISEQHAMIVDSHSRLDADGEPIPGTLDPAAEEEIARLQALINRIDAPMSSKPEGESNG